MLFTESIFDEIKGSHRKNGSSSFSLFDFFAPKCLFSYSCLRYVSSLNASSWKLFLPSEADQGAYSCEAINSQGSCFAGSAGCGQPGQVSQLSLLEVMTLLIKRWDVDCNLEMVIVRRTQSWWWTLVLVLADQERSTTRLLRLESFQLSRTN